MRAARSAFKIPGRGLAPSATAFTRFFDEDGQLRPDPQVERVDGPQWDGTTTDVASVPYLAGALLIKCKSAGGKALWKLHPQEEHRGFQMDAHRQKTGAAKSEVTRQKEEGAPPAPPTSGPAQAAAAAPARCVLDQSQALAVWGKFEEVYEEAKQSRVGFPASAPAALGHGYALGLTVRPEGGRVFADLKFYGPGCDGRRFLTRSLKDFKTVIGLTPATEKTERIAASAGKPKGRPPAGCDSWDAVQQCWLRTDGSVYGSLRIATKCAVCPAALGETNPLTGRPFAAHHFVVDHTEEEEPTWITSKAAGTAFTDLSNGTAQFLCLVHNAEKTYDAEEGAQGTCRKYAPHSDGKPKGSSSSGKRQVTPTPFSSRKKGPSDSRVEDRSESDEEGASSEESEEGSDSERAAPRRAVERSAPRRVAPSAPGKFIESDEDGASSDEEDEE